MFTLILLSLLIIFFKSFHYIYLFQIKEYRFDRFISFIKEEGIQSLLYSFQIKYPAKSFRNGLIVIYIAFTLLLFLLLTFEVPFFYYFLTFILPFAPVISLLLVAIGVFFTKFPAMIQRKLIIAQAKEKIKDTKTIFIGITGSYGKTSVKEYLYHILETTYPTGKTDLNHNTDVGVAISILNNITSSTKYFVAEFGAYKRGEIRKASYYIPLQYAILTGLGNQHLDLYGSRENLIKEETYLLKKVPEQNTVFVPYNSPAMSVIKQRTKAHIVTYGLHKSADIYAELLSSDPYLQKAKIIYKDTSFIFETKLLGQHTIENFLPAIAISLDLGVPIKNIQTAIEHLPQIEGKLSLHTGHKKALIINDGVNSNVDGFISAIKTLKKFKHKQKIIVSQGIIELGVEKRLSYERILEELLKTNILLYTTDTLFAEIVHKKHKKSIITFNDVLAIQNEILTTMDKHSAILIEGKFPKTFIEFILT